MNNFCKLVKVKIENFRSYDNVEINLNDLSAIVGKNDVGKSTILDALNIFFENEKPTKDDRNVYASEDNMVSITCFFKINPDMLINLDSSDSNQTQTTLKDEYLLNQDGLLQIKKVLGENKIINTFLIANHPNIWEKPLITLKINELKKIMEQDKPNINKTIKKEIRQYLFKNLSNDENFILQEIDVNTKDTDVVTIYNKLKTILPKFLIFRADRTNTDKDTEVVGVTKAITQKAIGNLDSEFNKIKEEVKQKIQEFSNLTLNKLKTFNEEIANSLVVNSQEKSLESIFSFDFISDDNIPFNKRGSGIKRLFLLSFFIADSEKSDNSNLIYAIEEPETSQHPDFQKIIIQTLQKISQSQNRQIILTTHTPEIAKILNKDEIIFIYRKGRQRSILQGNDICLKDLADTLGILPNISTKGIVCVEGETDKLFLTKLNKQFEILRNIFDIEIITIIPLHGCCNIQDWQNNNYLKDSNAKILYFEDRDGNKTEKDTEYSITTKKREIENYYPIEVLENYFKNKLNKAILFSESEKDKWDDSDIAKLICAKLGETITESNIKKMFLCEKIWEKMTENNIQDFEEIKTWFEKMKDFFEE
ncbi:ATP-binding protein [Campylobacter fetus]|uniref:ATP-binding protein n=1 Tax=Campylobacter fetus TaxID=196 RepID=UPI000818BCE8|nr:ATP-binding protein [Campylobacter fetus]OCS05836.1 ATP-dependent OLD family endonuclease [Campylobacter fetus subsp. testudinum]